MLGQACTPKVDVFSSGCVAIFALCGKNLFMDEDVEKSFGKTLHYETTFSETKQLEELSLHCKSCLENVLCKDANQRASSSDVLCMMWFGQSLGNR